MLSLETLETSLEVPHRVSVLFMARCSSIQPDQSFRQLAEASGPGNASRSPRCSCALGQAGCLGKAEA